MKILPVNGQINKQLTSSARVTSDDLKLEIMGMGQSPASGWRMPADKTVKL